jgi:phospholipase C
MRIPICLNISLHTAKAGQELELPDAMKSHRRDAPFKIDDARRSALQGIASGLGAALASSCGFPPTLAEKCAQDPGAREVQTTKDPDAQALLRSVDNFVVVMMENRSFDHLLGGLSLDRDYPDRLTVDGVRGDEFNLAPDGSRIVIAPTPGDGAGSFNPYHDWQSAARCWNGGTNDGFVRVNAGRDQAEAISYLRRDQIPFQYALADQFTVCDRWFASFMGPTWPNRDFLHATTSAGQTNLPMGFDAPPTIWERLALQCRSVKHYAAGPVLWYVVGFPTKMLSGNAPFEPGHIEDFFRDARSGNLPEFSIIDPDFKVSDGYPGHDLALAEAFLASIYRAMAEGPQWQRSTLIITYDEHGGYFDHVAPPQVSDADPAFQHLGFRVPAIVVGPTVWQGKSISTQFDHCSIASTMATRFGIRSMGARMDATNDLAACIDPARIIAPRLAPHLPRVDVDARKVAASLGQSSSQAGIDAALKARSVPEHTVDPRSAEDRIKSWLRHAQELEAVRVRS